MGAISWNYSSDEFKAGGTSSTLKLKIFFHHIWGWLIYPAEYLANGGPTRLDEAFQRRFTEVAPTYLGLDHSGYAVLQIVLSYFEMIGGCVLPGAGKASSTQKSCAGLRHVLEHAAGVVLPEDHRFPSIFYKKVRCGQYHGVLQVPGVLLSRDFPPLACEGEQLFINPHLVPSLLEKHLIVYCNAMALEKENGEKWGLFELAFTRLFPAYAGKVEERERLAAAARASHALKRKAQKLAGKSTRAQLQTRLVKLIYARHNIDVFAPGS